MRVEFDAIWCGNDASAVEAGREGAALMDMTSRLHILNDILEVTTKPIIFDAGNGGSVDGFVALVRTLERLGVSAILTSPGPTEDAEAFSARIQASREVLITPEFIIQPTDGKQLRFDGFENVELRIFRSHLVNASKAAMTAVAEELVKE